MKYEFLNRKSMTRDVYLSVLNAIIESLKECRVNTSLLLYGSLLDERLIPGVSDIDIILFFWDDFVVASKKYAYLGESLAAHFRPFRFDTGWFMDVSILDAGNAKDGRFIPYNDNFSKVFLPDSGDAQLLFGEPFIHVLEPVALLDPVEARIAFNLQSLRSYVLFGRCSEHYALGRSAGRELKILQQIRSLSRKIVDLISPNKMELLKSKRKCVEVIQLRFPALNLSVLGEIEDLFSDKERLIDVLLANEAFLFLTRALTAYEEITREVVHMTPMRSLKRIQTNEVEK